MGAVRVHLRVRERLRDLLKREADLAPIGQELCPPCGDQLLHRFVGHALRQRDGSSVVPLGSLQVARLERSVPVGAKAIEPVDVD